MPGAAGLPYDSGPAWDTASLVNTLNVMMVHPPVSEWYMDIGVTTHMSSSPSNLSILFPFPSSSSSIIVSDGSSIAITGSSHVSFTSSSSRRPLHLRDVLVTPHLIKNLVFVRKFMDFV